MKYRELYPTHKSTDRRRMAKQIIFSDSISITEIKDSKLDNWIETTLQKSKQNDDGVVVSNVGGYQTKPFLTKEITELLGGPAAIAIKDFTDRHFKFEMSNVWINENYKYSYNNCHFHGGCHYSGVYYYKVPKDSGQLEFHRTDATAFLNLYDFYKTPDTSSVFRINPLPGMLVVFPASFSHSVRQNMSEEPRVSVAFNFKIIDPDK